MSDIEEKLERDSLTIKEQIMNLQNTIKKLKNDMLTSNNNTLPQNNEITSTINNNINSKGLSTVTMTTYTTHSNS